MPLTGRSSVSWRIVRTGAGGDVRRVVSARTPAPQVRVSGWTPGTVRALAPSGLSSLNKDQIAERGARMARREDQAYRSYVREEQRSQPGCPPARWSLFSEDRPLG